MRVSVVVAAFAGDARLRSCLESLGSQREDAEVVVAAALEPAALEPLRQGHAWAEFVAAPPGTSVFRLRALALARARGSTALLLEDHCDVPTGWVRALAAATGTARAFAGGAVESGPAPSLAAWALYLVEYGALMPPVKDPGRALLAVNAAYPRAALEACRAVWQDGFHDNEVHDALRAAGHEPRLVPGATVRSHLHLPFARAAVHLFEGGRRFGVYRRRGWTAAERALRVLAAPLVPGLLLLRLALRLADRRPRALPRLVLALPYLAGLLGAWSLGELLGHLAPIRGEDA